MTSVGEKKDTRRVAAAKNVVRVAIGIGTAVVMRKPKRGTSVSEMKDTRRA